MPISPAALILASLPDDPSDADIEKAIESHQELFSMFLACVAARRFHNLLKAIEEIDDETTN